MTPAADGTRPLRIGLVFAPYRVDEPAGIERSIAALADGLQALGHAVTIVAAGPPRAADDPRVLRLQTLRLPPVIWPETFQTLLDRAIGLPDELDAIGRERRFDAVCWMDALWGLGLLGRPTAPRTGLMVHVLTGCEAQVRAALRHRPDVILAPSMAVIRQAAQHGLATAGWHEAPNGLLAGSVAVPTSAVREELRCGGPVRLLARLAPDKGVLPLLEQVPSRWGRPVETALAEAAFEYYPGMQRELLATCHTAARAAPSVRIVAARRWAQVRPFLAGASVAVVPSLAESFGLVALEALSVGTPVVAYAVGNLPALVGGGGVLVPLSDGPSGLWRAAGRLLADGRAYHAAARAGPLLAAAYTPESVARAWLAAWEGRSSGFCGDRLEPGQGAGV